jgi:ABC-type Fe3+ transport system permease subunit
LLAVTPPVAALLAPIVNAEALSNVTGSNHLVLLLLGGLATVARTAGNTLLYGGGAAALAACLGAAVALAVGRSPRLRIAAVSACIIVFSWPPAAGALGVAYLGATSPAALDVLLRSRFTVCLVLALHLTPVATALALRAVATLPPSWTYAAAVHGISVPRYLYRVLWPALRPTLALSMALVALLASADAGSVLLLHPPGEESLPLAIFTVMANAPEASVAALCLVYLLASITCLAGALAISGRRRA